MEGNLIKILLSDTFENFDKTLIVLNLANIENVNTFDTKYSYSFDEINFSDWLKLDDIDFSLLTLPIKIMIKIEQIFHDFDYKPLGLKTESNFFDKEYSHILIDSITYDGDEIQYSEITDNILSSINPYPLWNLYDNREICIVNYINQLVAISMTNGYLGIYFRTEPIETVATLSNHVYRKVVNIKKIPIQFLDGQLPEDRIQLGSWEQTPEESQVHIVTKNFERAFGVNKIPHEKDFLFVPLINKFFRVTFAQPVRGESGVFGFWDVFLGKFEKDECVVFTDDLSKNLSSSPDINKAMELFPDAINIDKDSLILDDYAKYELDTLISAESIAKDTIEEKKASTQNFTNKLVDTTNFISLKETENQREFINKRLDIISINPDTNANPVMMYNNSNIDRHQVGLTYKLSDYTTKNKFSLISKTVKLTFNFVLTTRFIGELFDLMSNNTPIFTLKILRNKLMIVDNLAINEFFANYEVKQNEFYNISLEYDVSIKQFSIKLFLLNNSKPELVYQNIYITNNNLTNIEFTDLILYGGSFLTGQIELDINENKILQDFVNPILIMKNR